MHANPTHSMSGLNCRTALASAGALGLALATRRPGASAQDATPFAGELGLELGPGMTAGLIPAREDAPALFRIRFAPDAAYDEEPAPVVRLLTSEAGTLPVRLDLPVTVAHGSPSPPTWSRWGLHGVSAQRAQSDAQRWRGSAQVAAAQLEPEQLAASLMAAPVP